MSLAAGAPLGVPAAALALVAFLGLQRLAELLRERRAARLLAATGALAVRPDGYAAIVAVHALWLCGILVEGAARGAASGWWTWPAAAMFLAGATLRYWSMAALGDRWSTRVWVLPAAPLVARGPYRWLRHPIYLGVSLELAAAPAALGLWWTAIGATLLNALALRRRIAIEDGALGHARPGSAVGPRPVRRPGSAR